MDILGRRKIFQGVWKLFGNLSLCCVRKCYPQVFILFPWRNSDEEDPSTAEAVHRACPEGHHLQSIPKESLNCLHSREMRMEGRGTWGEGEPTKKHPSSPTKFVEDFFKYRLISLGILNTSIIYFGKNLLRGKGKSSKGIIQLSNYTIKHQFKIYKTVYKANVLKIYYRPILRSIL